jgi:hypothetical protein
MARAAAERELPLTEIVETSSTGVTTNSPGGRAGIGRAAVAIGLMPLVFTDPRSGAISGARL